MHLRRRAPLLELVVQHGAVLVQRHDGVVRQLLLAQAAGLHELERDLELAAAGAKRALGGDMAAHAEHVGLAQAGNLVGRLRGARVVELCDQMLGIDGARVPSATSSGKGAPMNAVRDRSLGKRRARGLAAGAAHDVEGRRPVRVRHRRRLVPVVDRLVDQQQRLLAGREEHERIRRVGERRPHLERRLRAKRQVVIVEEQQRRRARVQQQRVVAGGRRARRRCASSRPRDGRRKARPSWSVFCLMAGEFMDGFYALAVAASRWCDATNASISARLRSSIQLGESRASSADARVAVARHGQIFVVVSNGLGTR